MSESKWSLAILPVDVFKSITSKLQSIHILRMLLTGNINLSRRLLRGGVTQFRFCNEERRPQRLYLPLFEHLSELYAKQDSRGNYLDTITVLPGAISAHLRKLALIFPSSLDFFYTLLTSGNHDFSGLEALQLLHSQGSTSMDLFGAEIAKLNNLRTLSLDVTEFCTFRPSHLPSTLTKCFIKCFKVEWDNEKPYSGLPPLLESLKIDNEEFESYQMPLPRSLTSFIITCPYFCKRLGVADIRLLPPNLKIFSALIEKESHEEIFRALPQSLTHLALYDKGFILNDHLKLLPRSLTTAHARYFIDASTVAHIPPALTSLAPNSFVDGTLVGQLPRTLTELTVTGSLVGALPPKLKTLNLTPLDASFKEFPSLTDLSVSAMSDATLLSQLPTTLTRLVFYNYNLTLSGFFHALPRNLRYFTLSYDQREVSTHHDPEILQGLPPNLVELKLVYINFKATPDWSMLPKYLKKLQIDFTIARDPTVPQLGVHSFKEYRHLESLIFRIDADLKGLGDLIVSNLPPNITDVTYFPYFKPTDTVSGFALKNLPRSLNYLEIPESPYSTKEISAITHCPKKLLIGRRRCLSPDQPS